MELLLCPVKERYLPAEKVVLGTGRHLLGQGAWRGGGGQRLGWSHQPWVPAGGPRVHLSCQTVNTYPVCALRKCARAHVRERILHIGSLQVKREWTWYIFTHCGFKESYRVIHEYLLYKGMFFRAFCSFPRGDQLRCNAPSPSGACTETGGWRVRGAPRGQLKA